LETEGVILAAGFSSRMKTYKMTFMLNGKALIQHCVEGMYNKCSRIIIVGGYGIENIRPVLQNYKKVELVFNPNYTEGMYSSVKTGLALVKGERFFLTPGDYPAIHEAVYDSLLNACGEIIIPAYKSEKGHPILMKSYLTEEILKSNRYSNLREFINDKGYKTVKVRDRGILMDIDTSDDYTAVLQYMEQNHDVVIR
jgi:molybdenum cofactor cytidylyltransferase